MDNLRQYIRIIAEGGNATAINRETGERLNLTSSPDTVAKAQKIDLERFNRGEVKADLLKVFPELERLFSQRFGKSLWPEETREEIFNSGVVFNGSSEMFFSSEIDDSTFLEKKKRVGDIDVTFPKDRARDLFSLLADLEGQTVLDLGGGKSIIYIGQVDQRYIAHQINSVFEYIVDAERVIPVQIDFEAVNFIEGLPNSISKFTMSSPRRDFMVGLKGLAHKHLMSALTSYLSRVPGVISTPTSTPEKIRVSKAKVKKPGFVSLFSFSPSLGWRRKYEKIGQSDSGQDVYREIRKEKGADEYPEGMILQTPSEGFEMMYGKDPSAQDLEDSRSFVGQLEILKREMPNDISDIFSEFLLKLFGHPGHGVGVAPHGESREYDPEAADEIDRTVKMKIVEEFIKNIAGDSSPDIASIGQELQGRMSDINQMAEDYYDYVDHHDRHSQYRASKRAHNLTKTIPEALSYQDVLRAAIANILQE